MTSRLSLLLWVFLVHLVGIYLFTRGFLLTRLSLPDSSTCSETNCGITPTHKRAVVLIIDALRFDFLAPNPPFPRSAFHHNLLTVPQQLTQKHPRHSFIFNAYADPPTATLQRIKGLTTGSLPTFVDIGNNFGGSSITEDSILKQMKMAGRKSAFMGDDTWMSVFPDSFEANMTFPFDSFNVEDLHTVDEGVIKHLFPLLQDPSKPFDFLIGHFLGVDHVGHRMGPDHLSMIPKLTQMNTVLKNVVDAIDDDTLLVVLGDHGMDRTGDHGGDGVLETSAAMWIYSKGTPLIDESRKEVPSGLLQYTTFPGCDSPHRSIQQIDIVPTLSLLLGIPIPFNNLGSVIPELFWRGNNAGTLLQKALQTNAAQIMAYLHVYRASPSGGELDAAWERIQSAWGASWTDNLSLESRLVTLLNFNRVALSACREMWAQFNPLLMGLGLVLLSIGLCASWAVYSGLANAHAQHRRSWSGWLTPRLWTAARNALGAAVLGYIAHFPLAGAGFIPGITPLDLSLFLASLASSLTLIILSRPRIKISLLLLILPLHALSFLSNSFILWEDRIVPFLLLTSLAPSVLAGLAAPSHHLRRRILGFSLLAAVCVRLMALSTVCREEQGAHCHVTYFVSPSNPSPPAGVLYLAIPVAVGLVWIMKRFLRIARAEGGVAGVFLPVVLAPALLGGVGYWIMDLVESELVIQGQGEGGLSPTIPILLRAARTWVARMAFGWILIVGGTLWFLVPLCLDIRVLDVDGGVGVDDANANPNGQQKQKQKQIQILGYANAYGASYLIFWCIALGAVYICTQLTGQIVLALGTVAMLAYFEVVDSVRDARALRDAFESSNLSSVLNLSSNADSEPNSSSAPPSTHTHPHFKFSDTIPLALLALHAFYSTGHQATISAIQWKAGFMLTPGADYVWSALTIVGNSVGPVGLFALGGVGVGVWKRAPGGGVTVSTARSSSTGDANENESANKNKNKTKTKNQDPDPDAHITLPSTLAALALTMYFTALLLGAALSAAILRRHLMVWKVFAPRFMTGVLQLLVVDVAVLLGVGVGVERGVRRVRGMFGGRGVLLN